MFKKLNLFFFITLSFLFAVNAQAASDLPDIGDSSSNVLTPSMANSIGTRLVRYLKRKKKVFEDPLVTEYINSLGNILASNSDDAGKKFHFFIIKDHTINAFAAPGRVIGIHSGLMNIAQTESELAAVLAHEVAHVTQHHIARFFEARRRHTLISTVAVLAALLIGDKELQKAAFVGSAAGSAQAALNFTRSNEKEADNIGMQVLIDSGFNPHAMPRFFGRMQDASGSYGTLVPEFLRTHPVSANRIAEATNRISTSIKYKAKNSINFYLIKSRIKVLRSNPGKKLSNYFRNKLKTAIAYKKKLKTVKTNKTKLKMTRYNIAAYKYGLVLSLTKSRRYAAATKVLQPLLINDPARLAYIIAQADIALGQKQSKRVKLIYDTALDFFPKSSAIIYYYGDAMLHLGKVKKARKVFQKYLANDPENKFNAEMHNLYALASARSGYLGEAYLHKAEFYYLNGYTKAAIGQLTKASQVKNINNFLAAKISARLSQLKHETKSKKSHKKSH